MQSSEQKKLSGMYKTGEKILLSICIPTYNRANFLEQTLESIVKQKRFQESNDVEIVISDNCSDDNTRNVSLDFLNKYGEKIRYFRNDKNIFDSNFEKVLSHGKGLFLKLNNDTLMQKEGSLDMILQTIEENKESKNILFFSNGVLSIQNKFLCENLNSFVDHVSFYSTWIGAFGIWKEDFDKFDNFNLRSDLHLTQVDVLYRLINTGKSVIVNNEILGISVTPLIRGGYDILGVFMDNYFSLLEEQFIDKKISDAVFGSEKKRLLYYFIRPWLIQHKLNPETYIFEEKHSFRRIYRHFNFLIFSYFICYYYLSLCHNYLRINFSWYNRLNKKFV
jgi:abequosyltransferase